MPTMFPKKTALTAFMGRRPTHACFYIMLAFVIHSSNAAPDLCQVHQDKLRESMRLADVISKYEFKHNNSVCENQKVIEVMSVDSRGLVCKLDHGPDGTGTPLTVTTFLNMSHHIPIAVINYLYAMRHGYEFRYIHLNLHNPTWNDKGTKGHVCRHGLHGDRASPWCKLLGIYDRVKHRTADEILFMDTDAVFWDHEKTLEDSLNAEALLDTLDAKKSSFVVASDIPFNQDMTSIFNSFGPAKTPMIPACTAVMVFRPNTFLDWFLLQWWNTADFHNFRLKFPYEQGTLTHGLLRHDYIRKEHVTLIDWQMMTNLGAQPPNATDHYIVHLTSGLRHLTKEMRLGYLVHKLQELGIRTTKHFTDIIDTIRREYVLTPHIKRLEDQLFIPVKGIKVKLPLDCCDHHLPAFRKYWCPDQQCP
eukprot:m.98924 g.98924  ORF g.98924 m.98924 type:complete len:419 (+) comp27113_c0_seq1:287-1543(+)